MRSEDGVESVTATDASDDAAASRLASSQSLASVTTSSSARSIASTFSTLDPEDIAFFDAVVAELPLGASSFKSLKDAYDSLTAGTSARQHGRRDEHRWTVLLNLTKVRGADWSEKWDTVRVGLGLDIREADFTGTTSVFSRDEIQDDSSEDDDATTRQLSASEWTQETSQSEGSDADDSSQSTWTGFDRASETTADRATTSTRPSTSASLPASTSKIGGTTTHHQILASKDYVFLRARMEALGRQASQLALRAAQSSISDGSNRPPDESVDSLSRSTILGNRLSQALSTRHGAKASSSESAADRGPTTRPKQNRIDSLIEACRMSRESLRDAAKRRVEESEEAAWSGSAELARRVYERRLASITLAWWHKHFENCRTQEAEAAKDRDSACRNRAFILWRSLAFNDNTLQLTAQRAEHIRVLLTTWRIWRRRAENRRDQRWETRKGMMKNSYTLLKARCNAKLLRNIWEEWREQLQERWARSFRNGHLLGGAFYLWRIKLDVSSTLGLQEAHMADARSQNAKFNVLELWRRQACLSRLSRQWTDSHDSSRVVNAFETWRRMTSSKALACAYDLRRLQRLSLRVWLERLVESSLNYRRQSQADRLLSRHRKIRAMSQWKNVLQHGKNRLAQAIAFRSGGEQSLVQQSLEQWRLTARLHLFIRVSGGRLQKRVLSQWAQQLAIVTIAMQTKAMTLSARSDVKIVAACWSEWRSTYQRHKAAASSAYKLASRNLAMAVLRQWRTTLLRHATDAEKAAVADVWFSQKRAFERLRSFARAQRLKRSELAKAQSRLEIMFQRWRKKTRQHVSDRLAVASLRAHAEERITQACLAQWTNRVIERRGLLLQVTDAYNERLTQRSLQSWRRASLQVHEMHSLGESFADVKGLDSLRRCMQKWLYQVRKARSLRERSNRFATQRTQRHLQSVVEHWYEKLREEQLRSAEVNVLTWRQERAKIRALAIWIGKTKPIPALHFHHTRLKAVTLNKWQSALPRALIRRRAIEAATRTTLMKALSHWMEKAKAKRGTRAAARFGGPSMGARLKRHSARLPSPFVVRPRRSRGGDGVIVTEEDSAKSSEFAVSILARDAQHSEIDRLSARSPADDSDADAAMSTRGRGVDNSTPLAAIAVGKRPPSANSIASSVSTATFSSSRPSRTVQSEYAYAIPPSFARGMATYEQRVENEDDSTGRSPHNTQNAGGRGKSSRRRRLSIRSEGNYLGAFTSDNGKYTASSTSRHARRPLPGALELHHQSAHSSGVRRDRILEVSKSSGAILNMSRENFLEDFRRRRRDLGGAPNGL